MPDFLCLSSQELGQIHSLGEDDVVLIQLNTAPALSLIGLISVDFDAELLLREDHVRSVVTHAHLADLLPLNVAGVVHSHVI